VTGDYWPICLSHDPGLELDHVGDRDEAAAVAQAKIMASAGPHRGCDLVLARYSNPLVEVACLPGAPTGTRHAAWHAAPEWVDVGWLQLLSWAQHHDVAVDEQLTLSVGLCWPPTRLDRLRPLITADGS